ncbi:MAG TPA: ligand-binding protein SH3 [bacterium (Candidatus Stahlbacteria)]|nr:ligand-binding protein SH3 [Candidatus Stahlbacteria bacterium]
MLPISELRGSIPLGINLFKLPVWECVLISIIGNILPIIPLLLVLDPLSRYLTKFSRPKKFFDWLFSRTRRRSQIVERYKMLGLMAFVAIPLPVTGAWTGAIAAFLFGIRFKHAIAAIFIGVLIAATIVTSLSVIGKWGALLAGIGLFILLVYSIIKAVHQKP